MRCFAVPVAEPHEVGGQEATKTLMRICPPAKVARKSYELKPVERPMMIEAVVQACSLE
jgi:hypothetical protein